jgi:SAM-dependent methyltransferase
MTSMVGSKRLVLDGLDRLGVTPTVIELRDRLNYRRDRATQERNAAFQAPDGLPLPPPQMVHKVVGHFDLEVFYEGGENRYRYIRQLLEQVGADPDAPGSVLDWGCGCGRVLRQWHAAPHVEVHGSDYNAELVDWCRQHLPFARLAANGLAPPLPFADDAFDLLYGVSVFTHLGESLQEPWMAELRRVVKPGGYILITVNGGGVGTWLLRDEQARFDAGRLVVQSGRFQGRNQCAAVHPEAYVRNVLARGLEVVAVRPATDPSFDYGQDGYLLRLPG